MRAGLTDAERKAAAKLDWYIVWHEDIFGTGSERDAAFEVARYLTCEEAEADARARGGPPDAAQAKWEGYRVTPANCNFLSEFDLGRMSADEVRALLRKTGRWGRWQSRLELSLGCLMVVGIPLLVVAALWWAGHAIWRHWLR